MVSTIQYTIFVAVVEISKKPNGFHMFSKSRKNTKDCYVMFGRDVLLCCVLCHRELKDVMPRNIIPVSRLSTREDLKSSTKYFSKMWHIMTRDFHSAPVQTKPRYKHYSSLTTNLRVSSAPAETRVAVSGERQVCNTLSVWPINSATRVIAGYLYVLC